MIYYQFLLLKIDTILRIVCSKLKVRPFVTYVRGPQLKSPRNCLTKTQVSANAKADV